MMGSGMPWILNLSDGKENMGINKDKILLSIEGLEVKYFVDDAVVSAVNGIDLTINVKETIGLVGETGAGKTSTALAIMRLIPDPPGKVTSGEIVYGGRGNLLNMKEKQIRKIRGSEISMIFQDPMSSLNPSMRVLDQITEVIRLHSKVSKADATEIATDMLEMVGIRHEMHNEYPHQFSGGMKQRVMIAIALACNPKLLIADEPTTALDVTIQMQVLELMNELKKKLGTSILLITHDLGIVAETCQKVAIMYAGEIIEFGEVDEVFTHTKHPYTQGLFRAIPSIDGDKGRLFTIQGQVADPTDLPEGCKFHPRCPYATEKCILECPPTEEPRLGHFVRCFLHTNAGEV